MEKTKKVLRILILLTLGWALLYAIGGAIGSVNTFTSFPWWSSFVFAAIYFGPVLTLEILAYGIIRWIQKKKQ